MPTFNPTSIKPIEAGPEDRRVGHILGSSLEEAGTRAVILGFPCDRGVVRNNGREGAAEGPDALRRWLYKFTPDPTDDRMSALLGRSRDLGNLDLSGDLSSDQALLGKVVRDILEAGEIPVVIGGGHETAYGHFLGYAELDLRVGISNIDAHADVRELKAEGGHSGSPFRQALEHPEAPCHDYRVAGLQPQSNSPAHLRYLDEKHCRYWLRRDTGLEVLDELYPDRNGPRYATFCLDALDAAFAPGVSAPAADGLSPEFWLAAAERAGTCAAVSSFDVVELNPRFDLDDRTARLAALTVWRFLAGLATRDRSA